MFAKSAVFFLALAALVNAAPVADYNPNTSVGPVMSNPIVHDPSGGVQPFKRAPAAVDLDFGHDGVSITLPHLKRQTDEILSFAEELLNALGSDILQHNKRQTDEAMGFTEELVNALRSFTQHRKRQSDYESFAQELSDALGTQNRGGGTWLGAWQDPNSVQNQGGAF
jgi:hypothetical protein